MRKLSGIAAMLLCACAVLTGCGGKPADSGSSPTAGATGGDKSAGGGKITIAWAQWKPSDYLETLAKDFTKETGIAVEVNQTNWDNYQQKIETDVWANKSDAYDLIVGDSQWLGTGATQGHYVDLTDWSKTNVPWDQYDDNIKKFYCEYNDKIWALPCEADATGFAYRKDLFEDPAEKAAFKAKYHYDLAPPETWEHFKDIAEFFTRPDKKLYGAALFYAGKGYDGVTMGFMQVLWCEGGDLFDPKTNAVQGVVNSPKSIAALDFYGKTLKQYTPPGSENFYFNECLNAFKQGQVAMTMDWFTFFPALADKKENKYADKTGFFVSPAGPGGHFISLGGQGISISSYSKHQDDAKKFLAWFSKKETQEKWAKLGGLTCNKEVLASTDFQEATPFNAYFAKSVPYLRDFYNNPQYAALLKITQENWNAAITGIKTAKDAQDVVATKQTEVLKEGGLLK